MASKSSPTGTAIRPAPGLREQFVVLACALAASATAVWWSWAHGAFLLYGDAEAHIHIARRLFDSHRPGLGQLGGVWLPLPHLLLVPFVAVDSWWRSGFAGVIPSACCYVLACLGLYRLARKWVSPLAASLALVFFAANPNLLYLQTTAMTEPLFVCELIWAVLLLVEWHARLDAGDEAWRLWAVIAVLVAAVWTRYDGWILAFLAWGAMAVCLWRRGRLTRRGFVIASVVLLLAPLAWMGYNAVLFDDWLDFMRGPYSARAIELRTSAGVFPPHPGWHNPWVSAIFFTKAAEMDAIASGGGILLYIAALLGMDWALRRRGGNRKANIGILWTLLLWLPLPFYAYSVSFGSVPIFLPVWWPHSWYNTRYGIELLPAFALSLGFFDHAGSLKHRLDWIVTAVLFGGLAVNVATMLDEGPQVFVEGQTIAQARGYYNRVLPEVLGRLHAADPGGLVLMDTSSFPSIVPQAGMTYRQTLNESDKQFFRAALKSPTAHARIVLAFAGDAVDAAVKAHPEGLKVYESFRSKNQPDVTIYVSDSFPGTVSPSWDSTAPVGR